MYNYVSRIRWSRENDPQLVQILEKTAQIGRDRLSVLESIRSRGFSRRSIAARARRHAIVDLKPLELAHVVPVVAGGVGSDTTGRGRVDVHAVIDREFRVLMMMCSVHAVVID